MARLDMHSFVTWHFLRLPKADELFSMPDDEFKDRMKWLKSDPVRKHARDFKVKRCIAEGQLVLTDEGLIPIQNVTLAHRVWDGVEWVRHGGLIDQGIREVVEWDGLTATPDHQVFLENGEQVELWQAASQMARLCVAGIGRQAVRTSSCASFGFETRKREHQTPCPVSGVWPGGVDSQGQPTERGNEGMCTVCCKGLGEVPFSGGTGTKVRCDSISLFLSAQSKLSSVRWSGNNLQVRKPERFCAVRSEEPPPRRLQGRGDRPSGQQRSLRAWEPEAVNSEGTSSQSRKHSVYSDGIWTSTSGPMGFSLRTELADQDGSQGNDCRGCDCSCQGARLQGPSENMEETPRVARFARVYDIADAGPRHRYTVSGKLVHNCVLGIGFGMGVQKLYDMYREDFTSLAEAKKLREVIEGLFPKVFRWQAAVRDLAHRQGYLKNDFGAMRWFYEVMVPDGRGGWKQGEQAEEAVAYLPASLAFGDMRGLMKEVARRGLDQKWEQVNTVHDSLCYLVDPNRLEEHCQEMYPVLTAPSKVLVDPEMAPGGLVVDVEPNAGESWAEMKEVVMKRAETQ